MSVVLNHFGVGSVCIASLMVLCYMIWSNRIIGREKKNSYMLAAIATAVVVGAELATVAFENGLVRCDELYILANIIGFALSPLIAVNLSLVFGLWRGEMSRGIVIPGIINAGFVLLSPWFGFIFNVSNGVYSRGSSFFIYVIAYAFGIIVLINSMIKAAKYYQTKGSNTLILIAAFIIIGTGIQVMVPSVHTSWVCVTISLMLYYGYICELNDKYDAVTQLFNRKVYENELESLENAEYSAVILFDVDEFKSINDDYGHQFGDDCLNITAHCIKKAFFDVGSCFRIGGDEFCVLSEVAHEREIEKGICKLEDELCLCRDKDKRIPMLSFGAAYYRGGGAEALKRAIRSADEQLYIYKRARKEITARNAKPGTI